MRNNEDNYIWIFGENKGQTTSENAFYFWKYAVNIKDNIDKYFVLRKNNKNLKIYNQLSENEKNFVLWYNSSNHLEKYLNSDMFFISSSYKDITPTKFSGLKPSLELKTPIVYLHNGFNDLLFKNIFGKSYKNNLFRFMVYNEKFIDVFKNKNHFKDYQLYNYSFPPKCSQLLKEDERFNEKNQIFWHISWRKYEFITKDFVKSLIKVLKSNVLKSYLKDNNLTLKLCVDKFYKKNLFKNLYNCVEKGLIEIITQEKVNLFEELAKSRLLISDYSSIPYDFTFLNKPVLLFQPDLEEYSKRIPFSCNINELNEFNIKHSEDLVNAIINEEYGVNKFFSINDEIDYDYIKNDKHIRDIYNYFSNIQNNKITFIGYNFHGSGGTVSATKSLAEGLLEKGYLIELISLIIFNKNSRSPYGLNLKYLYHKNTSSSQEKFNYLIHNVNSNYSYLKFEMNKDLLHPYCGYKLSELMKNIKTNTLVSTRESLHLFLNNCSSEKVKNMIYFFHAPSNTIELMFPGIMSELKKIQIDKAIFVTEKNRLELKKTHNYDKYESYTIIGNTLESSNMIEREKIKVITKKDVYRPIYLLRISRDRIEDINNLISFGKYLKENNIQNIVLDVFGVGDYTKEFLELLEKNNLFEVIHYRGLTKRPIEEIRKHDFMIDFSLNHSFGMTYIEAILNGKKVFCMKNSGSLEVMEDIPDSYINSYDWLCNQINNLHNIPIEELQDNYDKIQYKYSREVLASKFLEFIENY